jgi:hypothetical protein
MLNFHSNFKVKLIKQQTNLAAHTLARVVKSWTSCTLFDSIAYCIENIIINEMSWLCFCQQKKLCSQLKLFIGFVCFVYVMEIITFDNYPNTKGEKLFQPKEIKKNY